MQLLLRPARCLLQPEKHSLLDDDYCFRGGGGWRSNSTATESLYHVHIQNETDPHLLTPRVHAVNINTH